MHYILADRDQNKAVIWTGIAHDWKCAKPSDLEHEIVGRKYDDMVPRVTSDTKKYRQLLAVVFVKLVEFNLPLK
jgi:hypothetical protein